MLDVTRRELMPLVGGAGLVCAARVEQHLERVPTLVMDLVRRQVAVIFTAGGDAPAKIKPHGAWARGCRVPATALLQPIFTKRHATGRTPC
jgi:hypothetical protein